MSIYIHSIQTYAHTYVHNKMAHLSDNEYKLVFNVTDLSCFHWKVHSLSIISHNKQDFAFWIALNTRKLIRFSETGNFIRGKNLLGIILYNIIVLSIYIYTYKTNVFLYRISPCLYMNVCPTRFRHGVVVNSVVLFSHNFLAILSFLSCLSLCEGECICVWMSVCI